MKKDMKITDAIDYLNGTILANEKSLNNIILTKPKNFELKKYIGTFSTILIIGIIPTVTISLFMTDMFIKFVILSLSFTFFTSFLSTIDNSNGFMFNYISNSLNIDKYINLLDNKRKIEYGSSTRDCYKKHKENYGVIVLFKHEDYILTDKEKETKYGNIIIMVMKN